MSESHSNIRDEQFWFTAAVVGFNTVFISADRIRFPCWLVVLASVVVSLFGVHLILTRWLADSRRGGLEDGFDNAKATAGQRACHTTREIRGYIRDFPYVLAELSGSLFYLLLMALSFGGVVYRLSNN